ncbi:ABC transporter ATP-binding protein [Planctomycetota bacterium]
MASQKDDNSKESKQKLPTATLIRRMFSYFKPYRWTVLVVVLLHLVVVVSDLAVPKILGNLTDALRVGFAPDDGMSPLWFYFWLFAGMILVKNIFRFVRGWTNTRMGMNIIMEYRKQLHAKYMNLAFRYHNDASTGELIARTTRDVDRVSMVYFEVFISGIEAILWMVGVIGICLYLDWILGSMVTAIFTMTLLGIYSYARKLPSLWRSAADSYDKVTESVQENVAGVRVVKAFAQEDKEKDKFKSRIGNYREKIILAGMFLFSRMPMVNAIYHCAIPAVMMVGGKLALAGVLTVGDLVAVLLYLYFLSHRIRMYGRIVEIMQEAVASADRIYAVLDDDNVIPLAETVQPMPEGKGDVIFENVSFGYEKGKNILNELSVHITGGQTVGLLGMTGSGKSTIGALLPRFYDIDEGRILLDGVDIRELDLMELRRLVSVVFQETFLFAVSIKDNIRFGRPEAGDEEVTEAAKAAQIHDFIMTLKDGYDTKIGERGISLSGGQKQRVAIARAVLVRPRVLILDDATASVDSKTEAALQKAILSREDCTTIIVSQRISSVMKADHIMVIEKGRLAQQGVHDSLIEEPGLYEEMYKCQLLEEVG